MDQTVRSVSQAPGFYRYRLGDMQAIALNDGYVVRDRPGNFIRNADDAAVGAAFAEAGMPADKLMLTFNPLALETADGVVLIDTGFGESGPPTAGRLAANLEAAGITPADISTVIISHFHGDKDGSPTYPKAKLMVPQGECDYWLDDASMNAAPEAARANFESARRILDGFELQRFAWGDEILPGFTSVQANGHTPGMSAIEVTSGGDKLLYVADITNNPLLFVRHPDWQAMFDVDPEQTIKTRRRLLDRAAAEQLRLHFFHAPFPASGYVAKNGSAYEYLPALWTA
ncbi:MAG: MBL fold metallo-hydrolase [Acetobacteraceae bacterium]|nr:MBL fold metallo-hydrolase [Acetobacteraceae bacterium]